MSRSRLSFIACLLACGCLTSAFFFGPSKEKRMERAAQAIIDLSAEAIEAEKNGNYADALKLYSAASEKTLDFEKDFPKEDPTAMQLARTKCQLATERIRFYMETRMQEHAVAVTSDKTPVNTNRTQSVEQGYVIPSRLIGESARTAPKPAPAVVQPQPAAPKPAPAPVAQKTAVAEPAESAAELVEWARELMELGKLDKAVENLHAAIRQNPEHAEARFLLALLSFQRGDADTAQTYLLDLVEDAPSESVYLLLAAIEYKRQSYPEALKALDVARRFNPKSAPAVYNQALVFLEMPGLDPARRIQTATAYYQQALKLGAVRDEALEARLKANP